MRKAIYFGSGHGVAFLFAKRKQVARLLSKRSRFESRAEELRLHALGHTDDDRLLHVSLALRNARNLIRVISARAMSRKGKTFHVQKTLDLTPGYATETEDRIFWEQHASTDCVDRSRVERVCTPNLKPVVPHVQRHVAETDQISQIEIDAAVLSAQRINHGFSDNRFRQGYWFLTRCVQPSPSPKTSSQMASICATSSSVRSTNSFFRRLFGSLPSFRRMNMIRS